VFENAVSSAQASIILMPTTPKKNVEQQGGENRNQSILSMLDRRTPDVIPADEKKDGA